MQITPINNVYFASAKPKRVAENNNKKTNNYNTASSVAINGNSLLHKIGQKRALELSEQLPELYSVVIDDLEKLDLMSFNLYSNEKGSVYRTYDLAMHALENGVKFYNKNHELSVVSYGETSDENVYEAMITLSDSSLTVKKTYKNNYNEVFVFDRSGELLRYHQYYSDKRNTVKTLEYFCDRNTEDNKEKITYKVLGNDERNTIIYTFYNNELKKFKIYPYERYEGLESIGFLRTPAKFLFEIIDKDLTFIYENELDKSKHNKKQTYSAKYFTFDNENIMCCYNKKLFNLSGGFND